jgi:hypothetical protein
VQRPRVLHVGGREHVGPDTAGPRRAELRLYAMAALRLERLADLGQCGTETAGREQRNGVGAGDFRHCKHTNEGRAYNSKRLAAAHHAPGAMALGKNNWFPPIL